MAYTYINYNINQLPENLKQMIEESSRADLIEQSKDFVEYPFEWVTNFQFKEDAESEVSFVISMVFIIPIGQGAFQVVPMSATQTNDFELFHAFQRNIESFLKRCSR
jgi:hypothetical protein